jgi:acyl-CoA synthetase (AMP-forming)/AMP-acid ligase II
MELCFKPIKKEYLGVGTLPNGYFDQINEWKPLTKYLESGAKNYPEKLMFKIGNSDGKIIEEYSYLETNQKSNQVANGLIDFGIKKGDKVGMYMLNCAEFVFSILGTHKTGGVQVPINKDEKGERLAYVINYSEMQALVVDLSGLPLIEEIADKLTNLKIIYIVAGSETIPQNIGGIKVSSFVDLYKFTDQNPGIEIKIEDQERCMFTSGTTGMPKGVVREHGGVVMTVRSYLQYQGIRSEDILMSVLSLGHANAQAMCLFTSIGAGATAVFFS